MTAAVAFANPSLRARRLPKWAPAAVGAGSVALSFLLFYVGGLLGGGLTLTVIAALVLFVIAISIVSRAVEGPRAARNRVVTTLIYSACVVAAVPLVEVVYTLIHKGLERFDVTFFTHSNRNITAFDSQGGAYHAIVGTLQQAGIATLISVPLGILGAIYIVEYGKGRLANTIRFFVDVMTGIPSIVAGLFILSFWVLVVSPHFSATGLPSFSGFAAALALSVLMLPTVTRSTEEMLRLVPDSLREGSYALGIAKWKTIVKIVLPTATTGIVTGVMLAVARACGETAPVLLVAGANDSINFNPFKGSQDSLATYIYKQASLASPYGPPRAWTAALTLVALVLILTVAAKLIARRNKLK
jgi:phosphate transport system permease protein